MTHYRELKKMTEGLRLPVTDEYRTCVFSGRFDPPHLGHLFTIFDLAKQYGKVVIVILDYPERVVCSANESAAIFNLVFDTVFPQIARSKIDVVVNHLHFGKITFSEYDLFLRNIGACYNHTIYATGNPEVIENMVAQQIPYRYIERSMDRFYSGTLIRKYLDNSATSSGDK